MFGFLVAEVRTVQQLAETPWAHEREVFAEVEPGATVAAAPFRSDGATIGVRGAAPRLGEHTRACSPSGAASATKISSSSPPTA